MKKFALLIPIIFLLVGAKTLLAFDIPARPAGFVNDYADILTAEEKQTLEGKLNAFEKQTTNEIAVVTIQSLDGDVIENVAQNIFTKWGIGKKENLPAGRQGNNGVLLLVAMDERKSRIQTGYGVEGYLTDLATSYIQSDVLAPAFKEGNYYTGLDGAVSKMIEALSGNNVIPADYSNQKGASFFSDLWEPILFFGFIFLQFFGAILGRSKSWWGGGIIGGVIGTMVWFLGVFSFFSGSLIFVLLVVLGLGFDFIVSRKYDQVKKAGGHYPWWIGGHGGGFGGGGFGGFGGGGSGGGGSSGSW